jgi:hypothetical protein
MLLNVSSCCDRTLCYTYLVFVLIVAVFGPVRFTVGARYRNVIINEKEVQRAQMFCAHAIMNECNQRISSSIAVALSVTGVLLNLDFLFFV